MSRTPHRRVILDMDSSESPVLENRRERRTTVTLGARAITPCSTSSVTARGRCSVRGTYIARTSGVMYWIRSCPATTGVRRYFLPMPFAKLDIYEYLEARHVLYAIRLPGNEVLQREIAPLQEACGQAAEASCDPIRRLLVSCRELGDWRRWSGIGESCLHRHDRAGPEGVVRFYNGRGTAEHGSRRGSTP